MLVTGQPTKGRSRLNRERQSQSVTLTDEP